MVKHWNKLSKEAEDAPSLEAFRARLDVALGSLVWWLVTLHIGSPMRITVVLFNPPAMCRVTNQQTRPGCPEPHPAWP